MSAALEVSGVSPSRNHKAKLEQFLVLFGDRLRAQGRLDAEMFAFHKLWLKVRYENAVPSGREALIFMNLAEAVEFVALEIVASACSIYASDLVEELHNEVYGARFLSHDEIVALIHDERQTQAEILGEMGYGSKLGNKLSDPSRFCDLTIFADDSSTRAALVKDEEVGRLVAKTYESLLNLTERLQSFRLGAGIEPNEVPNFTFGLRLQYRGQSLEEIATWFLDVLKRAPQVPDGVK